MSKQQRARIYRKSHVSDGLDQLADLASAVANSVHGSSEEHEIQESQIFTAFATYPSTSSMLPLSRLEHSKNSLPTPLTKGYEFRPGNLLSFRELDTTISSRRMFTENSPLLPLHNPPVSSGYDANPQLIGNGRAAWLVVGLAVLVCVLFLVGLWLSEEIVLIWHTVETALR